MKDIKIIVDGRIKEYKVTGDTIDLRVERQPEVGSAEWALEQMKAGESVTASNGLRYWIAGKIVCFGDHNSTASNVDEFLRCYTSGGWKLYTPKPLLQDAKVGDWVELRSKRFKKIAHIKTASTILGVSTPIHTNQFSYPLSWMIIVNEAKEDSQDIIRLIPQNTPEWRELETAELLKQYPNIERNLESVGEGDELLLSNGDKCKALEYQTKSCFGTNYGKLEMCFRYDGKRYYPDQDETQNPTCLGIIKRAAKQYGFTEAFDMLERGELTAIHYPDHQYYIAMADSKAVMFWKCNSQKFGRQDILLSDTSLQWQSWVIV